MQVTAFANAPQKTGTPSLALFAQGLQIRLEQFVFNTHTPLEHYQQNNLDDLADYLDLALLELSILRNDLVMLQMLQQDY